MNHTRALPTDMAGNQKAVGALSSSSGLQLSKAALTFDQTEPGDESFLTLKITPPTPNTLVVLSVKDPDLFQVAVGVERLAFRQTLTFKPAQTNAYVHLRYTPVQAGRHQSVLIVEAPATGETLSVPLLGHTGGLAALTLPGVHLLPAGESIVRRPSRNLLTILLIGSLLAGMGYTGYVYRCQIWPSTCGPSVSVSTRTEGQKPAEQSKVERPALPNTQSVVDEPESDSERGETRSASSSSVERTQPARRSTETVARSNKSQLDESEPDPRTDAGEADDAPRRATAARSEAATDVPVRKVADRSTDDSENSERKTAAKAKPVASSQRTQPTAAPPKTKPVIKPNPSEESELERVLNKESN